MASSKIAKNGSALGIAQHQPVPSAQIAPDEGWPVNEERKAQGRRWLLDMLNSLAVKNVVMFTVIASALVVPIAYTYLRSVEQLLIDTLAAEVAVVAQRGSSLIDTAALVEITRPEQQNSPAYQSLRAILARLQEEFDVDNAVVMRKTKTGTYAYIADGRNHFSINQHVDLHDNFPETKLPADQAFLTGRLGKTQLFRSGDTQWFQVNAPLLDGGEVVGLLLINKFATPVAAEIERRQWQIVAGVSVVLLAGVIAWGYFAVRLARPLVNLRRASREISMGNLEVSIAEVRSGDEVGHLTRAFQKMVTDLRQSKGQIESYTQMLQREKDAFFRFVPTQFLELLGRSSAMSIELGDSSLQKMTVMFSDIRSFTTMAESLNAESVFGFLNEYLARMEPAIQGQGGFVNQFLGDGLMALFHDNAAQQISSADSAAAAAVRMRRELAEFNELRTEQGLESVRIGVGVHAGSLVLGTVGSQHRLNTTVVGDTVNLASRLEALTAHYRAGVIISEAVHDGLSDAGAWGTREIASVRVKGRTQVVRLYDLFEWEPDEARARKLEGRKAFAHALGLYRAARFGEARKAFADVHETNPSDRCAQSYIEKCTQHVALPPQDWEGVDVFLSK